MPSTLCVETQKNVLWHSRPICPWKMYLQGLKLNSMGDFYFGFLQQCFGRNLNILFWTEFSVHNFLGLLPCHTLSAGYFCGNISSWTSSFQMFRSALEYEGFFLLSTWVQKEAPAGQRREARCVVLYVSCAQHGQDPWAGTRWTWDRTSLGICSLFQRFSSN